MGKPTKGGMRRRSMIAGSAATGLVAGAGLPRLLDRDAGTAKAAAARRSGAAHTADITLTINGAPRSVTIDLRVSLLDLLREHLDLTGTKKGCDHGQCGACTVLLDGRRINACLTLAVMHEGAELVTIEGLGANGAGGQPHPLKQAFLEHDGFQCGYCTPGQICSAAGMLREHAAGWASHVTEDVGARAAPWSDAEIRERMSGNICRCATYPNILAAIREAAGARRA